MDKQGKRSLKRRSASENAYLLIVNPVSGQRRYASNMAYVKRYFRKRSLNLDIRYTERPGHATELAAEACRAGYDVVIGAGGDGTINEVLNGMIGSRAKMAILPWGTGNVFALEMNFPRTLKGLCTMIRKGSSLRLDAGKCGGRHFLLMCGTGFDAYSLKQTEVLDLKRTAGIFAYVLGGIRAFARYRQPEITVEYPDGQTEACRYALVSNTSRYGSFFSISPQANPRDGQLDLFLYNEKGRFAMLRLVFRVLLSVFGFKTLSGPSPFLRQVAVRRVKSIKLLSKGTVYTQLDGDFWGALPVDISIVPGAVNCILPGKAIRKMISRGKKP